ncbi:MAG: FHA domain-containing protein [Deltaproteobacteria bacterium]|nr:FHA domain-containing protein [Deltaproteobacteria bacterium]
MAMLRRTRGGRRWLLPERTRVGRAPDCDIRLEAREASIEHALIRWTDGEWRVRDLGSRNGTWVGTQPLACGEAAILRPGTQVSFGSPTRPGCWSTTRAPARSPAGPAATSSPIATCSRCRIARIR